MKQLRSNSRARDSKTQIITLGCGSSKSQMRSKTANELSAATVGEKIGVERMKSQLHDISKSEQNQFRSSSSHQRRSSQREFKHQLQISTKNTKSQISQNGSNLNINHPPKRAKKGANKTPISIQLYFNFMRWSFTIFACFACIGVYPVYMIIKDNCQAYRDQNGDVPCPISVDIMFSSRLIDVSQFDTNFESYLNYHNFYISRFFLFVMTLLAIWGQVKQRMILGRFTRGYRISEYSVFLVNLSDEADENDVREFAKAKYKEWVGSKKVKKSKSKEEQLISGDLVIETVTLANYDIGMNRRAERIEKTQDRIKDLEYKLKLCQAGKDQKREKLIKKLLKKYQTWLKIYQKELKTLQRSIDSQKDQIQGKSQFSPSRPKEWLQT